MTRESSETVTQPNHLTDSPRTNKVMLLWFGVFVAALIALGEISTLPRALEGIPAYDALDVTQGTLTRVGVCNRQQDIPIWVTTSATAPQQVWLPCAPGVAQIKQRVGARIELRSHAVSPQFLHPVPEIWSVIVDGAELYSYKARVARTSAIRLYLGPVIYALGLGLLYGMFVWAVLRDLSRRQSEHRSTPTP